MAMGAEAPDLQLGGHHMIITPAQMLSAAASRFPRNRYAAGEVYAAFYGRRDIGNTVLRCRETEVEVDVEIPEAELSRMMAVERGVEITMASVYWRFGSDMLPSEEPPAAQGHPFKAAVAHVVRCVRSAPDGMREAFDGLKVQVSSQFDRSKPETRFQSVALSGISYRDPTLGTDETVAMLRRVAPDRAELERTLRSTANLLDGAHPFFAGVGRIEIEVAVGL